jgi:hypothetical protein
VNALSRKRVLESLSAGQRVDVWRPCNDPAQSPRYQAVCDFCPWASEALGNAVDAATQLRRHRREHLAELDVAA